MKEMWLAFEGGGTKTRILLADTNGNVCAKEIGGPASDLYIDRAKYARETSAMLRRIKRAAKGLGGRVTTVGLAAPMDQKLVEAAVTGLFGPVEFEVAGEGDVALAFYGLSWGISLVAGTGSCCRAFNKEGRWQTCGGFGPQFGDEGSGHWIGRTAITAVMLESDGRGPATALTEKLNAFLGISRVWEIFRFVNRSGHISGTQIAAFTPYVFEAAQQGDAVARSICRKAGRELGKLINDTMSKVSWTRRPIPVVLSGGVFHGGRLIITPLKQALRKNGKEFEVHPPVTEPAEGIFKVIQNRRRVEP